MGRSSASHNPAHRTGFRWKGWRRGTALPADFANYPDCLTDITTRLKDVVIENRDAHDVLRGWDDPDTLHYVDPPYPHATRHVRDRNLAYRHEMSDDDHRRLAHTLHELAGMIILSGYPSDLYGLELYPTWARFERQMFKSTNHGSVPTAEVLWLNPAAANKLRTTRTQPTIFTEATAT